MVNNSLFKITNPILTLSFFTLRGQFTEFQYLHKIVHFFKTAPLLYYFKHLCAMKDDQIKNSWKSVPLRIVLLVFAIGFLIFGIYQTIIHGFSYSYWIFLYSLILFIVYGFVKNRKKSDTDGN